MATPTPHWYICKASNTTSSLTGAVEWLGSGLAQCGFEPPVALQGATPDLGIATFRSAYCASLRSSLVLTWFTHSCCLILLKLSFAVHLLEVLGSYSRVIVDARPTSHSIQQSTMMATPTFFSRFPIVAPPPVPFSPLITDFPSTSCRF